MEQPSEQSDLGKKLSSMWCKLLVRCSYRGCICGLAEAPEKLEEFTKMRMGYCVAKLEGRCTHVGITRKIVPRFKKGKKKCQKVSST